MIFLRYVLILFILLTLCYCLKDTGTNSNGNDLDTTSSNFVWRIDSLGEFGSYIWDVDIVSNQTIAVGAFSENQTDYNYMTFENNIWNFDQIPTIAFSGDTFPSDPLKSVLAFDKNDISVFKETGGFSKFDGIAWNLDYVWGRKGYIINCWGESSTNFYIVGSNGSITSYNGSTFSLMYTTTDIYLRDISGKNDNVVTTGYTDQGQSIALIMKDGNWETLYESDVPYPILSQDKYGLMTSVQVIDNIAYIISTAGIIKYNFDTDETSLIPIEDITSIRNAEFLIRANDHNDIILVSALGEVIHFNGIRWTSDYYFRDMTTGSSMHIRSLAFKGDMVVFGGWVNAGDHAIIAIGQRSE